ncbi:PKD domain-containing protein [Lunatimonas salinarum]|uniref:PKD domain-containing protein n=1 Tax=Lunatimonas salinarum TaxID=1774590 RepID=UPI001AE040C4|nr:PKD domain-containing protein [Lunatimonas salinarum]
MRPTVYFLRYLVMAWFALIANLANGQVGFPYCESFESTTLRQQTIVGGNARLTGQVLQLTQASPNQNGYVYIDIPFASSFGIKASFEYFIYGGDGADGLTMFLFDGRIGAFTPGAFGGSLGYAQGNGRAGLSGAYLGVGLDSFGNFGNQVEGKNGGFPGAFDQLQPNSIVVRGPASAGYPFVTGKRVNQGGDFGLPVADRFRIESERGRVNGPNEVGYRKVFIDLRPSPSGVGFLLTMDMQVTTVAGTPRMVNLFRDFAYPYPPPPNLKIGFSASTGGNTNFHEIRNLQVEVSAEDDLQLPVGSDLLGLLACAGQENNYALTTDDVTLPNDNSVIQCVRLYQSLDHILTDEEDICLQGGICGDANRLLEFAEGVVQVDDSGTGITFFPVVGSEGQEVSLYYTVTDNYGKTSAGSELSFSINTTPNPVDLLVNAMPIATWNICPGDELPLTAEGTDTYEYYEWYRFGELLETTQENEYVITRAGEYEVWAYNALGCPAKSSILTVEQPPFPELAIESPIVACFPEELVDVRQYIEDYDEEVYDYRVFTPDGDELVNEAMMSQYVAGLYYVSVKNKGTDCWSENLEFRIRVVPRPVEAAFDYGIDGSDRKADDDGFVLTVDPIWFRDQSTGSIIGWEWDFGDGNTSRTRNPVHIYGEKGDFLVTLTVRSEGNCESIAQMNIAIERSYRVMFPTGFTPTSNQNTHFRPKTKGISRMELLVFSVWGELLFQSDDLNTLGWDGNVNGKDAPPGTYVYRVNMVAEDGEEIVKTGKFLMVR